MGEIRLAIAGVGNCASSLVQGIEYYGQRSDEDVPGLMHREVGGYGVSDIRVVAAFDVDRRKVGRDLHEAIFAPPNCTKVFCDNLPASDVTVQMGPVLDGVAPHMAEYPDDRAFRVADASPCDVVSLLRDTGAEILVNYLPVGSDQAVQWYAQAAIDAGVALVNCMPVFIASDPTWATRFEDAGLPVVGDDIKAQMGATIVHRVLARLFADRGVRLDRTYQLNTGGNTDFLNMLQRARLSSKKVSKTDAVQSQLPQPLAAENIHIGPSDYVPWQMDNKVCFIRMEGRNFGDVPLNIELRLSVEDSPNSGGVGAEAIRCCKLALDRGLSGPLVEVSAYCMKHPPVQFSDWEAHDLLDQFIAGDIGAPPRMESARAANP